MTGDLPAAAPFASRCQACGTAYTLEGFRQLYVVGVQRNSEDPEDVPLDLRRCAVPTCGSGLALPLAVTSPTVPATLSAPADEEDCDG